MTAEIRPNTVHIVKSGDDQFDVAGISLDAQVWFKLPDEFRNLKEHETLKKKSIVKNAAKAIKPSVILDDDLWKIYFNEAENLCFKELPLEEVFSTTVIRQQNTSCL